MLVTLKRIIRSGWNSFSRDGGLAIANIFIMVMTISLVTSLFLLKDISNFLITEIQEKVDISVYFKTEAAEEDILRLSQDIASITQVKEVDYVSKEEAYLEFSEKHKDNPVVISSLEEVGINPFLASLNIKAYNANQYQMVADFLDGSLASSDKALIEKVDYYERKPIIERIFTLSSSANKVGIIFSMVLAVIAVLITFNTVRLAIYNSSEEIRIQRLVGASNSFIRGPFIIQGAILGFFSSLISFLLIFGICLFLSPKLEVLFSGLDIYSFFLSNIQFFLIIQLSIGIGLGVLSSAFAIRRYLKV